METFITVLTTAITTFLAAYFGARFAHRNAVKQKYYDNKTAVYLELSRIIPVIDDFYSQSDYIYNNDIGGDAETKIQVIDTRIRGLEGILQQVKHHDPNQKDELETEIRNLHYIREKHEEYLAERKALFGKLNDFKHSGHENKLRLFASPEVWEQYVLFDVSLDNEYKTNIGVTNDIVVNNMRRLIHLMREDLKCAK